MTIEEINVIPGTDLYINDERMMVDVESDALYFDIGYPVKELSLNGIVDGYNAFSDNLPNLKGEFEETFGEDFGDEWESVWEIFLEEVGSLGCALKEAFHE